MSLLLVKLLKNLADGDQLGDCPALTFAQFGKVRRETNRLRLVDDFVQRKRRALGGRATSRGPNLLAADN